MAAASPITRQTVGKTFIVAISLLGVGAATQMGALGWLFYSRFRTTPYPAVVTSDAGASALAGPQPKDFTDPFADAVGAPGASPASAAPNAPPPAPPRPSPISQQALQPEPAEPTPQDRFNELIEQGRALRERGDTYAAATKLREAQAIDPQSPVPVAELAMTYEKMGFAEKAAEFWKRIYEMGESAGVYYAAAEGKLKASQAQAMLKALPTAKETGAAERAPAAETVGLGPASKLGLMEIRRLDEEDPMATRRFTLRVPVRAKPRARIDVRDVVIQVLFYDAVGGKVLEKTNAQVTTKWSKPPPDWSDDDVEELGVTYLTPRPQQGEPLEDRKYYGYIVSVYYKGALQDFRSEPSRLAQQAPPPRTLPDTAQ